MGLMEKFKKLFQSRPEENVPVVNDEMLDEMYAKLDAYHTAAEKARHALEAVRAQGRPAHEKEKYLSNVRRYQKMFEDMEVEIRDVLDTMGLDEQKSRLAHRYQRLTGVEPADAAVPLKDLYTAVKKREEELEEAELQDEIMREQQRVQAERHRDHGSQDAAFDMDGDAEPVSRNKNEQIREQ